MKRIQVRGWWLAAVAAGGAYWLRRSLEPKYIEDGQPDWVDEAEAAVYTLKNEAMSTDATNMHASPALLAHLQSFEQLRLTPYRLNDGGWTIGWGRFYPDSGPPPPAQIDKATADAWFASDVVNRGEKWVKAYVTAPLTQGMFDGLTSMAYNMSPKSFATIADAVNQGQDPEAAAMVFTKPGTNLHNGLVRRRIAELDFFRGNREA